MFHDFGENSKDDKFYESIEVVEVNETGGP